MTESDDIHPDPEIRRRENGQWCFVLGSVDCYGHYNSPSEALKAGLKKSLEYNEHLEELRSQQLEEYKRLKEQEGWEEL